MTTTGSPVGARRPRSMRATSGSCAASTVCDPGGAVDVHDGRNPVAPGRRGRRARRACTGWAAGRRRSSARALGEHHRRDRPELLAALDVVEPLQVRRPPGVGQQAAVPERARAELAAALKPGDDAVVGQHLGDLLGDVGAAARTARRGRRSAASISSSSKPRPRSAPGIGSTASPRAGATCSAAPSAVPASPAAGCTQTSLERSLARQIRELATQLSADPAGHRQHAARRSARAASGPARAAPPRVALHAGARVRVRRRSTRRRRRRALGAGVPVDRARRRSRRRRSARTARASRARCRGGP